MNVLTNFLNFWYTIIPTLSECFVPDNKIIVVLHFRSISNIRQQEYGNCCSHSIVITCCHSCWKYFLYECVLHPLLSLGQCYLLLLLNRFSYLPVLYADSVKFHPVSSVTGMWFMDLSFLWSVVMLKKNHLNNRKK